MAETIETDRDHRDIESPRVLQVVLTLRPGGTERLVVETATRLADRFAMAVCCLDDPGAWAPHLTDRGIPVWSLGRRPGFRPGLARAVAALARRHDADVLHCHQYSPFVYGRLASLARGRPRVVFTEHGRLEDAPPSWKRRLVNPLLGRFPGKMFAVSQDLRRHMLAEGFPAARVEVIENGIDPGPEPGRDDRGRARAALGLPHDAPVVGTVARLDPVKDLPALVRAIAEVRRTLSDARLVIVGDGPELERILAATHDAGVTDAVTTTGHRDDARELLPAFDVFANVSTSEGISLTILEAMAATCPVVATAVGGTPEVVIDFTTGRLVPARSPAPLAEALVALLHDQDGARRLGIAGRRRVVDHFTIDRMVDRYAAVYRSVTPRPRRAQ